MAATNGYDVVGGIANSLIDFAGSSIMANSANSKNKRAQERANWFNIYNWQLQNEYNAPKNQVQRLVDSNLNPSMIYNEGSANNVSGTISSPGFYNAYSGKFSAKFAENIAAVQALKQQQAGIDKTEAEIDSIDNGIAMDRARLKLEQDLLPVRIALMTAQAFNQKNQGTLTQQDINFYNDIGKVFGAEDSGKTSTELLKFIAKAVAGRR